MFAFYFNPRYCGEVNINEWVYRQQCAQMELTVFYNKSKAFSFLFLAFNFHSICELCTSILLFSWNLIWFFYIISLLNRNLNVKNSIYGNFLKLNLSLRKRILGFIVHILFLFCCFFYVFLGLKRFFNIHI